MASQSSGVKSLRGMLPPDCVSGKSVTAESQRTSNGKSNGNGKSEIRGFFPFDQLRVRMTSVLWVGGREQATARVTAGGARGIHSHPSRCCCDGWGTRGFWVGVGRTGNGKCSLVVSCQLRQRQWRKRVYIPHLRIEVGHPAFVAAGENRQQQRQKQIRGFFPFDKLRVRRTKFWGGVGEWRRTTATAKKERPSLVTAARLIV